MFESNAVEYRWTFDGDASLRMIWRTTIAGTRIESEKQMGRFQIQQNESEHIVWLPATLEDAREVARIAGYVNEEFV